jgi:myo-inositol catabolism protein IolS
MEMRKLGKSDIELSVLGVGCWAFGGGKYWGDQNQKDVNEVVSKALDFGLNYFDTAEVYNDGKSEESLGIALKGIRHNAVIGTKISPSNTRPDVLRSHCEGSLKRLDTDYIDIYMVHWPITPLGIAHFTDDTDLINNPPSVEEAFGTLADLKKEGKIRAIGLSNFGVRQMEEVLSLGADIVVNELPYNLLSRAIEEEILPYCKQEQIGVIGYMALQQGLLAGIYPTPESVPPMQAHSRHFHHSRGKGESRHGEEGAEKEIFQAIDEIKCLAGELGMSIAQISLAWAMAEEAVACTLVGSRNIKELSDNIASTEHELDKDIIEKLNQITEPVLKKLGGNADYYQSGTQRRIC